MIKRKEFTCRWTSNPLLALYYSISKSSRPATILPPSNQLLQEHAEIAEENIVRKISARFAASCKILDPGFGCGCAAPGFFAFFMVQLPNQG